MQNTKEKSVVMIGATGAVGSETVKALVGADGIKGLTLLGRKVLGGCDASTVRQKLVDVFSPATYQEYLPGHTTAICTLGVGQPSKMSRQEFIKIDKDAVLDFAIGCKESGVKHFQLLASVAINSNSKSFYLRTKGELVEELKKLQFDRLSIFQPSMILTPENRYGLSQAVTLKVWPLLSPFLIAGLRKYRGIAVERLGVAIAMNVQTEGDVLEILHWDEFISLTQGIVSRS